jgi:hypothetical protein
MMNQLRPILAAVSSHLTEHEEALPNGPLPFITLSRQAGAGAVPLMHELLERLRQIDTDVPPWTGWHRELVERIAADHEMSASLVDALEDSDRSFLRQLLAV